MARIKSWDKFQHFKDRRPPWIKLYRDLLDDVEWYELDPLASKVLIMLWLIASETDGELPSLKILAFRLRLPENKVKSIVSSLSHWLEQDDITAISGRYQSDRPETETETQVETEEEAETDTAREVHEAFDAYNTTAEFLNLPVAQHLTPQRRNKLRTTLEAHGLSGWMQALANLSDLPFCLGAGERGWRADLDFLLQPRSFQRVLEKAYAGGTGPPPKRSDMMSAGLEVVEEFSRKDANHERDGEIVTLPPHRRIAG